MESNDPDSLGQPRLNFDVLRLICNDLTVVHDVLSFASTCSALRKGALQRRLRMSPVVLTLPDSLETFHKFIFADPTSRAPYLYGLELAPYTDYAANDDPRSSSCIVSILEAATRIEYLHFSTTIGNAVCATVAKITTLRELIVYSDWDSYTRKQPGVFHGLLTTLRSPLQHLAVADYETGQISASFLHDHLSHFAPTLTSLKVEEFLFYISPSSVTAPFTAMRSLEISSVPRRSRFYRLDVLLRLFPNLDDTLVLRGFTPPEGEYSAFREQSKEAQKDYTWRSLDRITLSAELAFMMALRCPIRRMDIDGPVVHRITPYLADALRDSCPRHLLLSITFSGHDDLHYLDGMFPPEAADRPLTHLVLFVEINFCRLCRRTGGCADFSWSRFLDSLVHSMEHLRLTHLRIIVYHRIPPPGSERKKLEGPRVASESDEEFAQNVAHDADLRPAAIRLLSTMQTLQYVFLTTCGIRLCCEPWKYWHSSKAWKATSVGVDEEPHPSPGPSSTKKGSRPCVEMDSDEAEAVIDEQELYLRRREEDMVGHCVKNAST
ncbi:hypothetical protein V8D89_007944 [Ganoderma adspersum]